MSIFIKYFSGYILGTQTTISVAFLDLTTSAKEISVFQNPFNYTVEEHPPNFL